MNAAVMTTGPGVIRPIATASRNWAWVSQWCWATTPSRSSGTIASPEPKTRAPVLRKNSPSETSTPPEARLPSAGAASTSTARPCLQEDQQQAGADDEVDRLAAGAGGDGEHGGADRPRPPVPAVGEADEFVGRDGDDAHDG